MTYTNLNPSKLTPKDYDFINLMDKVINQDVLFAVKLAVYLRNIENRRSVSVLLATMIIVNDSNKTELLFDNVIKSVDDICKLVDFYHNITAKPYLSVIKKNINRLLNSFDEKTLLSFSYSDKSTDIVDLLKICHPKATSPQRNLLFKGIVEKTIRPDTLNKALSVNGNNKQTWQNLIDSNKLTYLQKLSNLKNMIKNDVDIESVLADLSDYQQVIKANLYPHKYYCCYKVLKENGMLNNDVKQSLEKAVEYQYQNLPTLKGNTLLAVDVSGSLTKEIGDNNLTTYGDIARLLAVMSQKKCQDSTMLYFSAASEDVPWLKGKVDSKGYFVDEDATSSVLEKCCSEVPVYRTITDLHLPFKWAMKQQQVYDRIIYFTDWQHNSDYNSISKDIEEYRREKNKDCWIYIIDVKGDIQKLLEDEKVTVIAGWGKNTISLISAIEDGLSNLMNEIERVTL